MNHDTAKLLFLIVGLLLFITGCTETTYETSSQPISVQASELTQTNKETSLQSKNTELAFSSSDIKDNTNKEIKTTKANNNITSIEAKGAGWKISGIPVKVSFLPKSSNQFSFTFILFSDGYLLKVVELIPIPISKSVEIITIKPCLLPYGAYHYPIRKCPRNELVVIDLYRENKLIYSIPETERCRELIDTKLTQ